MVSTSARLGGAILIGAGVFQFTSLKSACLRHCRSPMDLLLVHWREGTWGALVMGLRYGTFCLGCCWLLMCVLFVTGVMNLIWVVVLTLVVLFEKALPRGLWVARFAGVGMIGWGVWLAVRG